MLLNHRHVQYLSALWAVALCACAVAPSPVATLTPGAFTASATQTAQPTRQTATPILTRPAQPTVAQTQSPPTAAVPLNPQGPWLVYESPTAGIVALNADGTAPTVLAPPSDFRPSDFVSLFPSPAPNGGWFAFWAAGADLALRLWQLPTGHTQTLALYTAEQLQDYVLAELVGLGGAKPAWSPDGQALAYGAAPEGVAGLYVYHLDTEQSTLLVNTPDVWVSHVAWSPQGDWLIYQTQAYEQDLQVWAVPAAGGASVELLAVSAEDRNYGGVRYQIVGWPTAQHLLWFTQPFTTEHVETTLQSIDLSTGTRTALFTASPYREAAYDPQSGAIALIEADGGQSIGPDYLALSQRAARAPERVAQPAGWAQPSGWAQWVSLQWWPALQRFSAVGAVENAETFASQYAVVLLTPGGGITELPNANNALDAYILPAPNGEWVAVYGISSLLRLYTPAGEPGPVFAPAIDGPGVGAVLWQPDGQGLYFVGGDATLYYVAALDADPVAVAEDMSYVLSGVLNAGHANWGWVR